MGSHKGDSNEMMKVEENKTSESEPTVEIKIKTLNSHTYTMRVDKSVPVPALKEKIATMTGILSEQQRLIFRGRVLKDDQLLSAYHVEDGHTLHLVVQEHVPPSESINDTADPDNTPSAANTQSSSVFVRTFNASDQTQGISPDISRDSPTTRSRPILASDRLRHGSQGPASVPDSLTTLSRYLNQMTAEFAFVNGSHPFDDGLEATGPSRVAFRRGMPTPETLAEVLHSTRQLLINQTAESLSRLATQLQNQVNVTDVSARMSIQCNAMQLGIIIHSLGALLLELGLTTMALRMGETPGDAVVTAGSAVFINEYGPNPMMGPAFPTVRLFSGAGHGTSFVQRYVDIRVQTGQQQSSEPVRQATTGIPPTDVRGSSSNGHVVYLPGQGYVSPATAAQIFEEVNTFIEEHMSNMFDFVNEQPLQQVANSNDQPTLSAEPLDSTPQSEAAPSDEGIFLSNPSSNSIGDNDDGQSSMTHEMANAGSPLRRQAEEPSASEAKRQKGER